MAGLIASTRPRDKYLPTNGGIVDPTNTKALPPIAPLPTTTLATKNKVKDKSGIIGNVVSQTAPVPKLNTPKVGVGTYDPALLAEANKWNITPEQTVQGQLANIVNEDGVLMQQARTSGLQQANARGLLNSGMAIDSAQGALYKTAVPIATSDADVNARSAGYNADEVNKFMLQNQQSQNQAAQFGAGSKLTQSESAAERALREKLQSSQQGWQSGENTADRALQVQQDLFQANVQASIADINNQASFDKQSQLTYGNLSQELMRQMAAINADVNMNQQSKDYAINQLMQTYKANVSMLSAVGSVPDVSQLLTFEQPQTYTTQNVKDWLAAHPSASDSQIAAAMNQYNISAAQMASATGLTEAQVLERMRAAGY
jgi:hypothetical protein